MFLMAAGFSLPALQPYAGSIAVGGTLAYILAFALGAGPVPATLVPELNPLSTRGKAFEQGTLLYEFYGAGSFLYGSLPQRRFPSHPGLTQCAPSKSPLGLVKVRLARNKGGQQHAFWGGFS